jgi:hypothetical protein
MAERRRLGAGTRALLGLPEPDPVEVRRKHQEYLASQLRRLNEIIEKFGEAAMPQSWREHRADCDAGRHPSRKTSNTVLVWGIAQALKQLVEEDRLDKVWRKNRPILDAMLADLATENAPDAAEAQRHAAAVSVSLPEARRVAIRKKKDRTADKRQDVQAAAERLVWSNRKEDRRYQEPDGRAYRLTCKALAGDRALYKTLSKNWPTKIGSRRKMIKRHYLLIDHQRLVAARPAPLASPNVSGQV